MWIEVVEWDGAEIRGILDNIPFEIAGLDVGTRVSVSEDSVFDYILRRADGTTEGNKTGKIIQRMTSHP
jgi:uncharacterized protein YegJ (DUF2314 family)